MPTKTGRVTKLRIFAQNYEVRYQPMNGLFGKYDTQSESNPFIAVHEGMNPGMTASVLLHEAFHLVAGEVGVELREHHVRALTCGLQSLLRDNKEFARALIET